jgi:hypothetical protein
MVVEAGVVIVGTALRLLLEEVSMIDYQHVDVRSIPKCFK